MVNYFIYAKDFSASTDKVEYYHTNGMKTLEQFKRDVEEIKNELLVATEPLTESQIIYLHWGKYCTIVDENKIREAYVNMEGPEYATDPTVIIDWLQDKDNITIGENDKIKLLYIITDGEIGDRSVQTSFELNEKMHYEKVVFHAINTRLNDINLSVAASFFKSRCMVYRNTELYDITDISKEFDYDKINVSNFVTERERIKSYIKLKFLRKFKQEPRALQEVDKLKKLRKRLFDELSMNAANKSSKSEVNLETKDRNVFLRHFVNTVWYKNLNTEVYDDKVEIEKSISTLINYIVSDSKCYSFDALKFDKQFNKYIEEEVIVDVDFTTEQEIEFPDVILDDDKGIPVVILSTFNLMDKIIFHETQCSKEVKPASFNKFKSTMDCPLFLVNDQDISQSIGYFYTLNVYKQLLTSNTKTDPRTRKPFEGGLVLIDTDQFDKYNDYILSTTYFNRKKINYNIGLFYFALLKNCENKEWMDRNVVKQFKKYTMRRISETVCKIGLSSLPLDPQENTSLLTALWYCVELSSYIFKNDSENFKHERLRMYHGVAPYMVEILKNFNYGLNLKAIEKRRELISYAMRLKKINKQRDKVYYLLKEIFKMVDGFVVNEIEKPFNLYKMNYLKLKHKEMLCDDIVDEVVHLNDYVHLMYSEPDFDASKAAKGTFEICEKTFRPFFTIDQNKSFYTELMANSRKVAIINDDDKDKIEVIYESINSLEFDKILSLHKLFINCVIDSEKYPTLLEYINYVSKKKQFNKDLVTIFPTTVYVDVRFVYEHYQKLVANVEVITFIKVCKTHVNRTERIKAEERVKFSSVDEIKKFICREELKVNLKKKT